MMQSSPILAVPVLGVTKAWLASLLLCPLAVGFKRLFNTKSSGFWQAKWWQCASSSCISMAQVRQNACPQYGDIHSTRIVRFASGGHQGFASSALVVVLQFGYHFFQNGVVFVPSDSLKLLNTVFALKNLGIWCTPVRCENRYFSARVNFCCNLLSGVMLQVFNHARQIGFVLVSHDLTSCFYKVGYPTIVINGGNHPYKWLYTFVTRV